MAKKQSVSKRVELQKALTGIAGFDDITYGGLPKGRPTLVSGGAGSGKTMFAMEFIVHGAVEYGEPGVYVTFEENIGDLKKNFASLGYDLEKLVEAKKIAIDHVFVERSQIEETGEYNLEALFIRLGYAIDMIGAKRVALDTIEVLFAGLRNDAIVRSEILRLFRWLKDRGITAVVTGEKGDQAITRYGLEEYIADCVIMLDNRVMNDLATRRLRIIKYRGSEHGADEYPFLIAKDGITIFPITSIKTEYTISKERLPTGIASLDKMLDGKGYYRGSSILITGTAGTGKTSFAAYFVDAACRRGENCLYIAFEESQGQIIRNMSSIGIDLGKWVKKGLLKFHISRPTSHGLETHLLMMEDDVKKFKARNVVIDPITDFSAIGSGREVKSMTSRLNDMMKSNNITILYTDLIRGDINPEAPEMHISSLIDTWIMLRNFEYSGERSRGLTILKSRGMPHSNQIREFAISNNGIELIPPYIGPSGVFMGSAKIAQEARDNAAILDTQRSIEHTRIMMKEKQKELEAKIIALKAQYKAEENELVKTLEQKEQDMEIIMQGREVMSGARKSDR